MFLRRFINKTNRTKLLRQNNTTYSFVHNGRIITVIGSNPVQVERAIVDQLKRNN